MNITSAQYKSFENPVSNVTENIAITITLADGQVWQVPLSTNNSMYNEIQRQVEAGDLTIADAD